MADYNTMKVPELKKLLSERGLTQAGNKADLIARLVDDDKQKAKASESSTADKEIPNEIDYEDDDDVPATTNDAAIATAVKVTSSTPAATNPAAPTKPALDVSGAPADAPATANNATDGDDKTTGGAAETGSLMQGLAPTNAKTEAEKRAARAARFGITYADDSEEARKAARAERFGVANDAVAALDSALPDRPRKRGRGGDEAQEDSRTNKRQSNTPAQTQGNQRNGGGRNNNNQGGRNQGGRGGRQNRRGGGPRDSGNTNGRQNQQKSGPAINPEEKAKMEARAKRFAA